MSTALLRRRSRQLGMTLVEVMVGVGIGVIGALAIFQTAAIWNRHTATTTAGGDAQVAGTLALFSIERDFKQAGHGFGQAPVPVMGCAVQATDTIAGRVFNFPLRPIDIVVGAAGAPDQINVLYGNSSFSVESQDFLSSTATAKTMRRRGAFRLGDVVVVADAGALPGSANCSLAEITSDLNPDMLTLDHLQNASYTKFYGGPAGPSRFNPAAGLAFGYVGGTMFNLGPRPQRISWDVAGNRTLQRSEFIFNAPLEPIADGVVNIKAEYGVDANNDTRIDATEWHDVLPVLPAANWEQVLAVRVALLVRSRQLERSGDSSAGTPSPVTTAAPTYFGTPTSAPAICTVTPCPFTMTNVDGTADTYAGSPTTFNQNNWRYYRYRVYERVIPLKNMLWSLPSP